MIGPNPATGSEAVDDPTDGEGGSRPSAEDLLLAYSVGLAFSMLSAELEPFSRVSEEVAISHGSCKRVLTIDWPLPTLAAALSGYPQAADPEVVKRVDDVRMCTIPIVVLRRPRLLNQFAVAERDGAALYVAGREESLDYTRAVLASAWKRLETSIPSPGRDERLLAEARGEYFQIVGQPADAAEATLERALSKFDASRTSRHNADYDLVRNLGLVLTSRHLIWVRIPVAPGTPLRLTVSYRTRYAAEYETDFWHRQHNKRVSILIDNFRRFVGQDPSLFRVPVALHSLARSYHFHLAAPPGTFVWNQHFFLQRNVADGFDDQKKAFKQYYRSNGATVSGEDQAGGPFAHLYATNLPGKPGNQVFALVRVFERPPGTTAAVTWISLLAAVFLWLYWMLWARFASGDTAGIDVAAFLVAVPGLASVWFSKAFDSELRPNIPLLNRLALAAVGMSAVLALVSVLLERGICSSPQESVPSPCPPIIMAVFGRPTILAAAVVITLIAARLIIRRILVYRIYKRLQVNIANIYLR